MFIDPPNTIDDTPEEREKAISSIISLLGLVSIGELIFIDRYMKKLFRQQFDEAGESELNIYEKKKQEIKELLTKYEGLARDLANVQEEKEEVEIERDGLAVELERIGQFYEELTGRKAQEEDIKELLSIYITLMEKVFSGRAHFKVLSLLHGEKAEWTREEITKSTGIAGITIRQAIGDLIRAGFITFDEETTVVRINKEIASLKKSSK